MSVNNLVYKPFYSLYKIFTHICHCPLFRIYTFLLHGSLYPVLWFLSSELSSCSPACTLSTPPSLASFPSMTPGRSLPPPAFPDLAIGYRLHLEWTRLNNRPGSPAGTPFMGTVHFGNWIFGSILCLCKERGCQLVSLISDPPPQWRARSTRQWRFPWSSRLFSR